MEETHDSKLECLIEVFLFILGLIHHFKFENMEYDRVSFRQNRDSIEYNRPDINKSRYLLCRRLFPRDMPHAEIEDRLRKEEFDDEQVKI